MIRALLLIVPLLGISATAGAAVPGPPGRASADPGPLPGPPSASEPRSELPMEVERPAKPVLRGPVTVRKIWEISIGSRKWRVSLPESIDPLDLADRVRGFFGMFAIIGVAVFLSTDRAAISGRVLFWGIALQWLFAILVLRVSIGVNLLRAAGDAVESVLDCALAGAEFVFGEALVAPDGPVKFVFAFRVLPTVIFVAALFAVLYHVGIMQWIVRGLAWVMARLMGTSGAETLDVAASLFLGQTEAPLTIRPYLPRMTNSELMTVMTAGMAHVSGGVMAAYFAFGVEPRHVLTAVIMTAPGAIMMSKLLVPETGTPETLGTLRTDSVREDANLLDAASRGTREGLGLALNIAAMLITFLGLIALLNLGLARLGTSLQAIFGWALAPVAYFLGVPWEDCRAVGGLLGTRTVLNELIAYGDLARIRDDMLPRSSVIAGFALCGFANIGSIGIQLGGIGSLAPERRHDLARLGVRALLAGTLANYLSACIAGVLL
jgi:CNT family concentrative nucleoside transporter